MTFTNVLAVTPFFLASFLSLSILTSCGGGSDDNVTNAPIPQAPAEPAWVDAGTLGNDIIYITEDIEGDNQQIIKFSSLGGRSKLTPAMPAGGKVARIIISPDGKKIAYLADQELDNIYELFVSNADGSINLKVSNDITQGDINFFAWSGNSEYIIYGYRKNSTVQEYFLANFDGTIVSELTYNNLAGQTLQLKNVQFINNGIEIGLTALSGNETHIVVIDVGTRTQLRNSITEDIIYRGLWSNNGQYYAYLTDAPSNQRELKSMDTMGGSTEMIIPNVYSAAFYWSPFSSELAYWPQLTSEGFDNPIIFNAIEKNSTAIPNLNGLPVNSLGKISWADNGNYLVYQFGRSSENDDLLVTSMDGNVSFILSELTGNTNDITRFALSSDDTVAVLTDFKNILTYNLDGTNLQDFSSLALSDGRIRSIGWTQDSATIVVRHYNLDINGYTVSYFEPLTRNIETVQNNNQKILCFAVADASKPDCKLFFDRR